MDLTTILSDHLLAIENRWGSIAQCPDKDKIERSIKKIRQLKKELKSLKQEKSLVSKGFRTHSNNENSLKELKEQSHKLASLIKKIQAEIKFHLVQLENIFSVVELETTEHARFTFSELPVYNPSNQHSQSFNIVYASDKNKVAWDAYVNAHPRASLYHLYDWRSVLTNSQNANSFYLTAVDDKQNIVGLLPMVNLKSRLFGNFLVSMPYVNYGGPLGDSLAIESALLKFSCNILNQNHADHFEVRSTYPINDWIKKTDKVSMVLKLPQNSGDLETLLSSKVRAQVKRARNNNLVSKIGHAELLDDFYDVFSRNMRDLGTPVYSKSFFACLIRKFEAQSTIIAVYHKAKPVAGGLLLAYKDIIEIPWASSLRSHNRLGGNMLMYADALQYAADNNFSYFDFGRSSVNAPTYNFKKQWGAQPIQHYWHYWLPEGGALPELNPDNAKYRVAINLWKKMPVWLTKLIGPRIVANLP